MSHRRPPRTENRFRQREVSRAFRAARDAGEAIERVEIDPQTGRIIMIVGKGDAVTEIQAAGTKAWEDATEAIVKAKKGKSAPTRR
jgi:hypothetical protein